MKVLLLNKSQLFRQGDVLVMPIEARPAESDLELIGDEGRSIVLAHGEATGHAHAIYPDRDIAEAVHSNPNPATLYRLMNVAKYCATTLTTDCMYLEARTRCFLRHEEHDTISFPAGHYVVIRQHEGNEMNELRRVAD